MNTKERMEKVGMTQVDMILELQKRGYAVQPPMLSSILRGVYTYPKANAVTAAFSRLPTNIQRAITVTNRISQENNKATNSYMNLYAKIKMAMGVVRNGARVIASWITQSNQYIEDVNLFTASMGKYTEEAQNYAKAVSDALGIDPGEFMRNQGVFNTIISGFGVASDKAYLIMADEAPNEILGADRKSINLYSYISLCAKAVQELSDEVANLKREIEKLKGDDKNG